MNLQRHWILLLLLSIFGVIILTIISLRQMDDHLKQSFVYWVYMFAPIAAYVGAGLFVWIGAFFMKWNDALFGTTFQVLWFLRLNVIVGSLAIFTDILRLFDLHSGYLPLFFACGSGALWIACYSMIRIDEQAAT